MATTRRMLRNHDAILVLLVALFLRSVSVLVTTVTSLNTYAQADANGFAHQAERIADAVLAGSLPLIHFGDIYDVWGAMLSPFWMLPGPSRVYARFGVAVLGALAVYNVYLIVRNYHSKHAGLLSILPMMCFPSFLFLHASVLREAMVLFGLTVAARLFLVPGPRLTTIQRYGLATFFIGLVSILRDDNLPVYLLVIGVAGIFTVRPWHRYNRLTKATLGVAAGLFPVVVVAFGQHVLEKLLFYRQVRARGRTAYLGSVLPETIPEAIAFSWIGASYFLFTPFPWMISHVMDFVVAFEGLINVVYVVAAVTGARVLSHRTLPGTMALVVGIVIGTVLYGLGTVNVGTAVRHRPMILWAIFLLGGIGIAEHVRISISGKKE